MLKTRITEILGIRYPILQGDMAWITGWETAAVEGDTSWGSLMMGQVAGMIRDIKPVDEILDRIVSSALDEIRTLGRYLS